MEFFDLSQAAYYPHDDQYSYPQSFNYYPSYYDCQPQPQAQPELEAQQQLQPAPDMSSPLSNSSSMSPPQSPQSLPTPPQDTDLESLLSISSSTTAAPKTASRVTKHQSTPSSSNAQRNKDGKFACSLCDKAYTHNKHLRRHMMRHTGQKPYPCQYCHTRYTRPDIRKRHESKCKARGAASVPQEYIAHSHPLPTPPPAAGTSLSNQQHDGLMYGHHETSYYQQFSPPAQPLHHHHHQPQQPLYTDYNLLLL